MPFSAFFMDTPFSGAVFIFSCMVVSVLGLFLFRRTRVKIEWLKEHHEVASFFFLMIGTLYAVLVAFAIFVVWTQFQDAGTNLEHEANEVGDLSHLSMMMPPPLRHQVRSALLAYLNAVVQDEFPAMAEGRDSQRTWTSMENLWSVYDQAEVSGVKEQTWYAESLRHLNELSDDRRVRLFTSRGTVPSALWYLLYSGGIVLIAFTYLFGHESFWSQAGMTAALAGVLAFSLFLIVAYNSPYAGAARVNSAPFQVQLDHVSARGAM